MLAISAPRPQGQLGADRGDEVERVELEQHIEAEKAVDAKQPALASNPAWPQTGRCWR